MNKPIDQEEQRFAQMLKIVEPDVSPADQAFLDQLKARTTEAFRAAGDHQPGSQLQPQPIPIRTRLVAPFRSHAVRRLALAASILIAAVAGFAWWSTHHAGIAFAQVLDAVERVRYCSFTLTITSDGAEPQTMHMMVRDGTRLRQEMADTINIIDLENGKFLALVPAQKMAVQGDLTGLPEDAREKWDDYSAYLKKMLTKAEKVEDLGFREVAGRNAQGFRITKDGQVSTVWVDPESGLPLESIQALEGAGTRTCTDFDFRAPADESLFELNLPSGYTMAPVSFNLSVQDSGEQDLVEMLRVWTRATGGQFPDSLSMSAQQVRDALEPLEDEIGMLEGMQIANAIARGAIFMAYAHDPHYVGAGVQLGQADKPVFWHKPKGSELYHVIYGDLSVREMPAGQLPKIEKTTTAPAQPAAVQTAPVVIETVPAKDALDMDPTTEVRITFDQDMRQRGKLWVEATEPNLYWSAPRKPVWLDARTCRIPVQLKGHSRYAVHLNQWTDPAQYLKTDAGQAVQGWEMAFTTAPSAGEAALTPEQNRAAVEKLRDTLHREYPHLLAGFDLRGRIDKHTGELASCKGRGSFAVVLQRMLTGVRSSRVEIWYSPNQPLWVSGAPKRDNLAALGDLSTNSSWDLLPKLVPNWQWMARHTNAVMGGRFPDGIGYITLHSWGDEESAPNKTIVLKAVTDLGSGKGLILDLRSCGSGGSTKTIEALAGRFIDQPVLYGRETPRNTSAVASGESAKELRLLPNTAASHVSARLVVLVGPGTCDINERLALMLKQAPGCVLIGGNMVDDLGTNESLDLGNGVRVMLPKYGMTLPDGTDVADGVRPDIEVAATQGDFNAGRDPVLEAALKTLRQ